MNELDGKKWTKNPEPNAKGVEGEARITVMGTERKAWAIWDT
jgi:hypothetical protein